MIYVVGFGSIEIWLLTKPRDLLTKPRDLLTKPRDLLTHPFPQNLVFFTRFWNPPKSLLTSSIIKNYVVSIGSLLNHLNQETVTSIKYIIGL